MTNCEPECKPSTDNPTHAPSESRPRVEDLTHASSDSGLQAENLTHAPAEPKRKAERPAQAPRSGQGVLTNYQRSRLNVFIAPTHRQQIDALSGEWNCPLTEAVRRVLGLGLSQIMQADLSE